ncbi:hypothetical protein pneo_cds_673 [Pandoravirus neocaledonia]|uniref:Uncharacterized protein n=1 Tax=Pandoravirus neocaledonia TaxID=2107708 RepID=A0A2U7UD76_9VIRU|nr:hypothetical protein pneo_cds_673 [Pandoravirus neocaledonia]AVK76280.1 hypothetical protein pneo_cds_673 [Pandoravirus neocaledonia]
MHTLGKSKEDGRGRAPANNASAKTRPEKNRSTKGDHNSDDKDDGQAFKSAVDTVVADLIDRHRRQITGRLVVDQTRRQGHGDAAKWMRTLGDRQLAAFLSRLSCVYRALVVKGHADDNVFIVPATLTRRPMSAKRARREWGTVPNWVARSWTLVSTPQQCRRAVADLRQRPFVSVVVDASHRHDLGLVHIGALGDANCMPRCYTFDTCATPEMEWCGAGDLFDAGGLADLLGDARLPKAVCGFGCGHSRIAHRQSEALMRTPAEIATQTPTGFTGVMVRGAVNVLPVSDDRVSGAVAIALRGRDLDVQSWQRAGAAMVSDKWQWQRRPLPAALCADAAQRAFTLCVAYEALCDIAGSIDPAHALVAQSTSDGLLCFAAAQTLAQTTWKSMVAACDGTADGADTLDGADEWDELERAVRSYVDAENGADAAAALSKAHAHTDGRDVDGSQSTRADCVIGCVDRASTDRVSRDDSGMYGQENDNNALRDQKSDLCAGRGGDEDDGDDWYGDGRDACADVSGLFYEPPEQRPAIWSRIVIEF